jgi:hypothetical protein
MGYSQCIRHQAFAKLGIGMMEYPRDGRIDRGAAGALV